MQSLKPYRKFHKFKLERRFDLVSKLSGPFFTALGGMAWDQVFKNMEEELYHRTLNETIWNTRGNN